MAKRSKQQKRQARMKKQMARKRELAARDVRGATSSASLIRRATPLPPGPSFISAGLADDPPTLVSIVVTRRAPGGVFVAAMALVDRTCLGIKNGMVRLLSPVELAEFVDQVGASYPSPMEECNLLMAQSVVYHALDYAHALGFEPHRDFAAPLFGPRPERLLNTPHAKCDKPFYVSGPRDDVAAIMAQLKRVVPGDIDYAIGPIAADDDLNEMFDPNVLNPVLEKLSRQASPSPAA